jgi:hypothetical protein
MSRRRSLQKRKNKKKAKQEDIADDCDLLAEAMLEEEPDEERVKSILDGLGNRITEFFGEEGANDGFSSEDDENEEEEEEYVARTPASEKQRKLIDDMDKAMKQEVHKMVAKKSRLMVLREQVVELPWTLDLDAVAKEVKELYPVSWSAVKALTRNHGTDSQTLVRLCMLVKVGGERFAALAYVFSFAMILDGVARKGFKVSAELSGLTYAHSYACDLLRKRIADSTHHVLFRIFKAMQATPTEMIWLAFQYDNLNLRGNAIGFKARLNDVQCQRNWTTRLLMLYRLPGATEQLDFTKAAPEMKLDDAVGTLIVSDADLDLVDRTNLSKFLADAAAHHFGALYSWNWSKAVCDKLQAAERPPIGHTKGARIVLPVSLHDEAKSVGTQAVLKSFLLTQIEIEDAAKAELEYFTELMALHCPGEPVLVDLKKLGWSNVLGADGRGMATAVHQVPLMIEDLQEELRSDVLDDSRRAKLERMKTIAEALHVVPGGFHIANQILRRIYQSHQQEFSLGMRSLFLSLQIGTHGSLPSETPSIKKFDSLMDFLLMYVEGIGLSALSFYITNVRDCEMSKLRKSTLSGLCGDFVTQYMAPFVATAPGEDDPFPVLNVLFTLLRNGHRLLDYISALRSGNKEWIFASLRVHLITFCSSGVATPYRRGILNLLYTALADPSDAIRQLASNNFVLGDRNVCPDQILEFVQDGIQRVKIDINKSKEDAETMQGVCAAMDTMLDYKEIADKVTAGKKYVATGIHVPKSRTESVLAICGEFSQATDDPGGIWSKTHPVSLDSIGVTPKMYKVLESKDTIAIELAQRDAMSFFMEKGIN